MRIPAFTISAILSSFDPNTTAFGGVATGNINAHKKPPALSLQAVDKD